MRVVGGVKMSPLTIVNEWINKWLLCFLFVVLLIVIFFFFGILKKVLF